MVSWPCVQPGGGAGCFRLRSRLRRGWLLSLSAALPLASQKTPPTTLPFPRLLQYAPRRPACAVACASCRWPLPPHRLPPQPAVGPACKPTQGRSHARELVCGGKTLTCSPAPSATRTADPLRRCAAHATDRTRRHDRHSSIITQQADHLDGRPHRAVVGVLQHIGRCSIRGGLACCGSCRCAGFGHRLAEKRGERALLHRSGAAACRPAREGRRLNLVLAAPATDQLPRPVVAAPARQPRQHQALYAAKGC